MANSNVFHHGSKIKRHEMPESNNRNGALKMQTAPDAGKKPKKKLNE